MTTQKRFYGWTLLGILWVIFFINASFPMYGGSVLNAYMARDLDMERSILGLGFAIVNLLMGFSAPLVAFFINRKGVHFTLFLGSLILLVGALAMAALTTRGWHYVLSFGLVVFKSIYEVIAGDVFFSFMHLGMCGTPIAACHAGGVLGGLIMFALLKSLKQNPSPSV